jgi:ornithine--oxo-acid transaminase
MLGKALGGGMLPVSAFVATNEVMQVFRPGDHGSTFGGNPLAAAVALEALAVLLDEKLIERSRELGGYLLAQLKTVHSPLIRDVRGKGLFVGIEVDPRRTDARTVVDRLLARGLLSKDTRGTVVRFAPPLVIAKEDIDWRSSRCARVRRARTRNAQGGVSAAEGHTGRMPNHRRQVVVAISSRALFDLPRARSSPSRASSHQLPDRARG